MFRICAASAVVGIVMLSVSVEATILNVPDEYGRITEAIASAGDGDTVLIAEGSYNEGINFSGKKITVAGTFLLTGDSSSIENTVIFNVGGCGPEPDDESTNFAVLFDSTEDETSVLTGVEIRNMRVRIENMSHPSIRDIRIVGEEERCGASSMNVNTQFTITLSEIRFINSSLSFYYRYQHCIVRGCSFVNSYVSRSPSNGTAVFTGNEFVNSSLSSSGTGFAYDSISVEGNTFNNSYVSMGGTGQVSIYANITGNSFTGGGERRKAGISCSGTGDLFIDAKITGNTFNMAGIDLGGTGDATIHTEITDNTFEGDGESSGVICGGTGFCTVKTHIESNQFFGTNFSIGGTGVFLVNANIVKNIFAEFNGSAIHLDRIAVANYTCNLANNTIVGNKTGIQYDNVGGLTVLNCIIWGNSQDLVNVHEEQISYSLWESGLEPGGVGNITGDPMLMDPGLRDFSLKSGSPCIGTGTISPFSDFMNPGFRNNDMGAVPYLSTRVVFGENTDLRIGTGNPAIQGTLLRVGKLHASRNEVNVFDMRGRLVQRVGINSGTSCVDMKSISLRSGSYVVRVIRGGKAVSLRYLQK